MIETKIEWASHTFNPWEGCTKVSPGCVHCYAETRSHRLKSSKWGPSGTRVVRSESYWREPLKWNKWAEWWCDSCRSFCYELSGTCRGCASRCRKPGHAERPRVFCASLADVFEDWTGPMVDAKGQQLFFPYNSWEDRRPWISEPECGGGEKHITMNDVRRRLFALIDATPNLDYLLLTKRPENVGLMALRAGVWGKSLPRNVWLGVSVENQAAADERIPHLLRTPAAVRFLSCEPLLGPVDLTGWGDARMTTDPATAPKTWGEYPWPEWVPAEQRKQIEDFWSASYHRNPRQWLESARGERVPELGARVGAVVGKGGWGDLCPARSPDATVTGRYLHSWNNVGRLVTDDGRAVPVSSARGTNWLSKWLQPDGIYRQRLHWVIVGGESGHGARPMLLEWARSIVGQCQAASVPVFVKQLGSHPRALTKCGVAEIITLRDRKGGDMDEWPADLRVRELPTPHGT